MDASGNGRPYYTRRLAESNRDEIRDLERKLERRVTDLGKKIDRVLYAVLGLVGAVAGEVIFRLLELG